MKSKTSRQRWLKRGLWLSAGLLLWNVVEGVVAIAAGVLASSVALLSFGIDSSVEVLSAVVVSWRLWRELRHLDSEAAKRLEQRTARLAGALLLILAAYIVIDAGRRLLGWGEAADSSLVGIVLTLTSLILMPLLGWAKLSVAGRLNSAALRADAYETIACAWLSLSTLVGLALNAAVGWSWADPVAALLIVPLVIREGWEAWRGEECCHESNTADQCEVSKGAQT